MKIKSFQCEQFAGKMDMDYEFDEHMNVILGKNEAGKSTLLSAIFYTLFQRAKIDKRSDKEFVDKFFPKGMGKSIDGKVTFVKEGEEYRLERVWGEESLEKLRTPEGYLRGDEVEPFLEGLLSYGAAVYDQVVFSRQDRREQIIEGIFADKADGVKSRIQSGLSQTVAEMDGVEIEKLNSKLNEKLELLGGNWDFESQTPRRSQGAEKRWKKGNGEIVTCYYERKDLEEEMEQTRRAEDDLSEAAAKLNDLLKQKALVQSRFEQLDEIRGVMEAKKSLDLIEKQLLGKRIKLCEAKELWPKLIQKIELAEKLAAKKKSCELLEQITALQTKLDDIGKLKQKMANNEVALSNREDILKDYSLLEENEKQMFRIKAKLEAMKLKGMLTLCDGKQIEITTGTKEAKKYSKGGPVEVEGYVKVTVPEVMELTLTPEKLDARSLRDEYERRKGSAGEIFEKYHVKNMEDLLICCNQVKDNQAELKQNGQFLNSILAGQSVEEMMLELEKLQKSYKKSMEAGMEPCDRQEVDKQVTELLKTEKASELGSLQGALSSRLEALVQEYQSLDSLCDEIEATEAAIHENEEKLLKNRNIPEKYRDDTTGLYEADYKMEKARLQEISEEIDDAKDARRDAQGNLPEMSYEEQEILFHEKEKKQDFLVEQYGRYIKIQKALEEFKNKLHTNPLLDVELSMQKYLKLITNGLVSLETITEDFSLEVKSGKIPLNKDILSEGTKETIALAFRLAVLEHFYPNGDGMVVLDDTLLDLDMDRREQAVSLLNDFAKKNQVIFATCDTETAKMLGGNLIQMK